MGLDDARKPLRSKLLAVPSLQKRYLEIIQQIAKDSMSDAAIVPVIEKAHDLLATEVKQDTKKLSSYEAFERATASAKSPSLQSFFAQRRKVLLEK